MIVYEVRTKSGEVTRYGDPDEMETFMLEENDLEWLETENTRPVLFDIKRDTEAIRNLKPGMTWRNSLAEIKCLEVKW